MDTQNSGWLWEMEAGKGGKAHTSLLAPRIPPAAMLIDPAMSSARPAIITSLASATPAKLAVTAKGTVMPSDVPRTALYKISLEGFQARNFRNMEEEVRLLLRGPEIDGVRLLSLFFLLGEEL